MTRLAMFRCEATVEGGIGHVMRCRTLASRLEWLGWECCFVVSHAALDLTGRLTSGYKILDVGTNRASEPDVLASVVPGGCALLVVDNYSWDAGLEARCRRSAQKIMVIDDLADRSHDCDFLLDQTTPRTKEQCLASAPGATILHGSRFALLRDEFRCARARSLDRRRGSGFRLRRLLVGFGGTDPTGLTMATLDAVADTNLQISVMVSSVNPMLHEIAERVDRDRNQMRLHVDVSEMANVMAESDLAIGAGGGSAWERCTVGLPTLLLVTADNQREMALTLSAAGAARIVDNVAGLADAIAACEDEERDVLAIMSKNSAAICDGLGTIRVTAALAGEELDHVGRPCRLEAAGAEHIDMIFHWQNAPGNRKYARSPSPPSRVEHEAWFANCIADPRRLLFVVVVAGRPVGTLRLDQMAGQAREVSILLDPSLHGVGIGKAALSLARRAAPGCELIAEILPGNKASLRVFQASGYRPTGQNRFVHVPA